MTELKLIRDDAYDPNDKCVCGENGIDLVKDALSGSLTILISKYLKIKNQDIRKNTKIKIKIFRTK